MQQAQWLFCCCFLFMMASSLGPECYSHVVLRIQSISRLWVDVKQAGKFCFAQVSCCERHQHIESFFCQYRIRFHLRSPKVLQVTIGKFHLDSTVVSHIDEIFGYVTVIINIFQIHLKQRYKITHHSSSSWLNRIIIAC